MPPCLPSTWSRRISSHGPLAQLVARSPLSREGPLVQPSPRRIMDPLVRLWPEQWKLQRRATSKTRNDAASRRETAREEAFETTGKVAEAKMQVDSQHLHSNIHMLFQQSVLNHTQAGIPPLTLEAFIHAMLSHTPNPRVAHQHEARTRTPKDVYILILTIRILKN